MISKRVLVNSKKGLRSRMVSKFIKKAMDFKSNISIECNGKIADGKSLINVLALKVSQGEMITISASGDDEVLAVDELITLVRLLE